MLGYATSDFKAPSPQSKPVLQVNV